MITRAAGSTPPPCAGDPDRWFDNARRTAALLACLQCPIRRACARDALRLNATGGMWAGIWIDGDPAAAAPYLRAIVADVPPGPVVRSTTAPAPVPRVPPPLPHRRPSRRAPVAATVTARASGHCEVLGPWCRLTGDRHVSRIVGRDPTRAASAAEVFLACRRCAETVSGATHPAYDSGHLVAPGHSATGTAFHWRTARWVLLGAAGELFEVGDAATRCA